MGKKTRGILPYKNGRWEVDKWLFGTRLRQSGFASYGEAETWLIERIAELQIATAQGVRGKYTFDQAAAHYVNLHADKVSLETDIYLLSTVMPFIGPLELHKVHDDTLRPYKSKRLEDGRAHKTINLALAIVRRILNLAAHTWRDDNGLTWLAQAPKITMLPLPGFQREARPISWSQQRMLMSELPPHLTRMALFTLNTGVRDDVVCSLRWEWEIFVPELGISVFEVPRRNVKGRQLVRAVICNSVAQSVVESARGQHPEFVFVYRRERIKDPSKPPKMPYRPIQTMHNTAWQTARRKAGLGDLHVHDLRHTVGMRLREAGVAESTISDVLWHSKKTMTRHYSVAQIVELHQALEKIKDDSGRWNKSLATLRLEHEEARRRLSPHEVPTERQTQK